MARKLPEPRYITPASIDLGDVIRVVWKVGDIEHSRTAKVAFISERVFYSADEQEIFRWNGGSKTRVTLLSKEVPDTRIPLFDVG